MTEICINTRIIIKWTTVSARSFRVFKISKIYQISELSNMF